MNANSKSLKLAMEAAQAARDTAMNLEHDTMNTAEHETAVRKMNKAQDRYMEACNAYYAARDAEMNVQDRIVLALGYLRVGMMSNDTGLRIKAEQAIAVLTQAAGK